LDNDILEFYGDAELYKFMSDWLFDSYTVYPDGKRNNQLSSEKTVGQLSEIRKNYINKKTLAHCLRLKQLDQFVLLGKSDLNNNAADSDSILEDVFEALIGAVKVDSERRNDTYYLTIGYTNSKDAVKTVCHNLYEMISFEKDWLKEILDFCNYYEVEPHFQKSGYSDNWTCYLTIPGMNIKSEGKGKTFEIARMSACQNAMHDCDIYDMKQDVGEADSALILCGDEAMLVDTGNSDQGSMIRLYLKQHNVNGLKYLLLTHSDRDHIGGAASVISNIEIENLFMCRYEKDNDVYANMMNEINYKNMSWSTPDVGAEYQLGDATITIIAPNRDYDNPNDSSIAFVIRHGEDSFIFTGDAEETAEADIVNNGLDISADVYYVGHHGSHTSSTQPFLDKVNPKYAVISCAKDNEYGHPHIETMEKLKAMGVSLFRTDDQGSIICYSDNNGISFNAEPSDNWANGNAEINESMSTQVVNSMVEATNAVEEEQISEELEITYVLNTNSMKFHKPSCDSVNDMKEKNRQDVTLNRDEVIELGYQGCKRCNP